MRAELLNGLRRVGVFSEGPGHAYRLGTTGFLATAVGDGVLVWDVEHLRLMRRLAAPLGESFLEVTALETVVLASGPVVVAGSGSKLVFWNPNGEIHSVVESGCTHVSSLVTVGDVLVCGGTDGVIAVWRVDTETVTLENSFSVENEICKIFHPATYLNKILIGLANGKCQLWNFRTQKLIFEFDLDNEASASVMSFAQSAIPDVVAIGLSSGNVIAMNLKLNKKIVTFEISDAVSSLAFVGPTGLAVGSVSGSLFLFELETRKIVASQHTAHSDTIAMLWNVPGDPLILSSSLDNSIRMWVVDQEQGWSLRVFKERVGMKQAPSRVRFSDDGRSLLVCSGHALRLLKIFKDQSALDFSAKDEHMQPVKSFSAHWSRQHDWDSLITSHERSPHVFCWSLKNRSIGKHRLELGLGRTDWVTALQVSNCGNSCFVGTAIGVVAKFNLQSGLLRLRLKPTNTAEAVSGVCPDGLGKTLTVIHSDGVVNIWDLFTGKLIDSSQIAGGKVIKVESSPLSGLIAVGSSDLSVRLLEITSGKVVRVFSGLTATISDVVISNDGRWVLCSCADGSLRIWDVPSGALIECFSTTHPIVSIALSPGNEYLATTLADCRGVLIWRNRAHFEAIPLRSVPNEPIYRPFTGEDAPHEDKDDVEMEDDLLVNKESWRNSVEDQVPGEDLIKLSGKPKSYWESLPKLQEIKKRNRPKKQLKTSTEAPFFLPTTGGLEPQFVLPAPSNQNDDNIDDEDFGAVGQLGNLLITKSFDEILSFLRDLTPGRADMEIRSLGIEDDEENEAQKLLVMLEWFADAIKSGKDLELVQACLSVFLDQHSSAISKSKELRAACKSVAAAQKDKWVRIENSLDSARCLSSWIIGLKGQM